MVVDPFQPGPVSGATETGFVSGLNLGPVMVSAAFGTIRYYLYEVTATQGALTLTEVSP